MVIKVDAIRFHQSPIEERNWQVLLMGMISRTVRTVQVWLGEATPGSDGAIIVLKEHAQGETLGIPLLTVRH